MAVFYLNGKLLLGDLARSCFFYVCAVCAFPEEVRLRTAGFLSGDPFSWPDRYDRLRH